MPFQSQIPAGLDRGNIRYRLADVIMLLVLARITGCTRRADTPRLGDIVRRHRAIESMHWDLDRNLCQDRIKRKTAQAARNLDTIQRIALSVFSIWKGLRRKRSDKRKGVTELMRYVSMSFTRLKRFLSQK